MKDSNAIHIKDLHSYYKLVGLGSPLHPNITIYPFADVPDLIVEDGLRFSLGFYVITLKLDCTCKWIYGQNSFDYDEGVLGFFGPNQIMEIDAKVPAPRTGWCLLVDPDFLSGYSIAREISSYHFWDYTVNESLILSENEQSEINLLLEQMRKELLRPVDVFSQDVLIAQLGLLLTFSNRFYQRQFITRKPVNNQILTRFKALLDKTFAAEDDIPANVDYYARKLNLSPKYLSDVLKQLTGLTTQQFVHNKMIEVAKEQLQTTQLTVSQIAYRLGFYYPQSFNKLFKSKTQMSPLEFRRLSN